MKADSSDRELESIESEFCLSKNSDGCRLQELWCHTSKRGRRGQTSQTLFSLVRRSVHLMFDDMYYLVVVMAFSMAEKLSVRVTGL